MRYQGRLQDWNDEKGYGFVMPNGGGARAFVHIKAFDGPARRPSNGDVVTYEVANDAKGRTNATRIRFAARAAAEPRRGNRRFPGVVVGFASLASLAAVWLAGGVPVVVPLLYAAVSLATYLLYAMDKSAAQHNQWRIQENSLHLFALLGGWPGALVAQQHLRHKSVKAPFRFIFWITVLLNLVLLIWMLHSGKADALNDLL